MEMSKLRSYLTNDTDIFDMELLYTDVSPNVEIIAHELFRKYQPFCWRRTYGRGVGHPLNACPTDQPDKSGLLCYPKCQDGYIGIGPVCWEDCGNMTAVGIFCVGTSSSFRLLSKHDTFLKRLFSIDSINDSNYEYSYARVFIRKSYGRGAGTPMICSSEYEQSGALCYVPCDKKFIGVGPVCWQLCPSFQSFTCVVGCAITASDCITTIWELTAAALKILKFILGDISVDNAIANLIASATQNDWPAVAKNTLILSEQFTEKVLSYFLKKFNDWPVDMIEETTKNTSVLLTVSALQNAESLAPFTKLFSLDYIIAAFNKGLCDLPDELSHSLPIAIS
ncbi:unnamed protein product [Rotaria sp. Silwood1]|nr:unnamed protein product [Rotaria sp. Silwood1]CAF1679089.1 unnamed protein product [Rotaria sp. Silwood1]